MSLERGLDEILRAENAESARSDAHFTSEQALFNLPEPIFKAAEEDLIDIQTFLGMGHAADCWCRDYEEPPELVSADALSEENGWIIYSTANTTRSPSILSAGEWEWSSPVGDDENEMMRIVWPQQVGEDDACAWKPSTVAHGRW